MHLILDYPTSFLLLCLLAGALYSGILYFRSDDFSKPLRWALASLRFLVVTLLSFLLLSPLVRVQRHEVQRPIVVVAHDNSRSLVLAADSSYNRDNLLTAEQRLLNKLDDRFDLHFYRFDAQPSEAAPTDIDYRGLSTDFSSLFDVLVARYRTQPLAAVVLLSDGIYNSGRQPLTVAEQLMVPVHCVALGDTAVRRHVSITRLRSNRRAVLGSRFPVEIGLHATQMQGSNLRLSISRDGKTLATLNSRCTTVDHLLSDTLWLDADALGMQQYTVTLTADNAAAATPVVRRVFAVEVIDAHRRVLVLTSAPHPDIAALRAAMEQSDDYQVEVRTVQTVDINSAALAALRPALSDADVVVLHRLASAELYRELQQLRKPIVHIVAPGISIDRFNAMHSGVEIQTRLDKYSEATALSRSDFVHFQVSDMSFFEQLPPLQAPFGDYRLAPHVQPLFYARIGDVVTTQPLMAVSAAEPRQVWVLGDGIWRWRMSDYRMNETHSRFDDLMLQMVTFAGAQSDASRLRIVSPVRFPAGSPVVIEAELYDSEGQLTRQPDVTLTWKPRTAAPSEALSLPFSRSAVHRSYTASLGVLPAGIYSCRAATRFDGEEITTDGYFLVEDLDLEQLNLMADHALLRSLARISGGVVVAPDSMAQLATAIDTAATARLRLTTRPHYGELLHLPWVLALLLLLVSLEWVLRKRNGRL